MGSLTFVTDAFPVALDHGVSRPYVPAQGACGPLAQLVEQLTLNQLVVGSIPTRLTTPTTFPVDADPKAA